MYMHTCVYIYIYTHIHIYTYMCIYDNKHDKHNIDNNNTSIYNGSLIL